MPLAEAQQIPGLQAVFGEAYPDPVRVVSVHVTDSGSNNNTNDSESDSAGRHSIELCGGTHIENAADAMGFVITGDDLSSLQHIYLLLYR